MDFSSPATAGTYSDRSVDTSWMDWARQHLAPAGRDVVDIGCGGGIYSRGFAALGARSVVGIDGSAPYVDEAQAAAGPGISFHVGDATGTGLLACSADIVFERALIHHLDGPDQAANAAEALRLLRPGGVLVVQDRTIEDVESNAPAHWIRATLFELFPRLRDFERQRRPVRSHYAGRLTRAGFRHVDTLAYDEVRQVYSSVDALRADILARKGKSILFELSDAELQRYAQRLVDRASERPLVERDLWTVWRGIR